MSYRPYAGVGARKAPRIVCALMTVIADDLESRGYTLRSGGARGSDSAFERGVVDPAHAEIFIPFEGYNGHASKRFDVDAAAFELAKRFHPGWARCSDFAQACFARNCYQVLGRDLVTPSRFVVCWTRGARDVGGTGHTLRVARAHSIPVFNLCAPAAARNLAKHLKALEIAQ